jgi:thioredoxin reductase (NADPH)
MPEKITVYGTTWCPDCKRAKKFLGEQRIQYRWVDIEQDPEAADYVAEVSEGKRIVPTIVFPDGSTLVEPSNAELAEKLGLQIEAEKTFYDAIIIGGGPAGLTAALYLARDGMETLVIEKGAPGGQAADTQMIENFPGFDEGITGDEFARRLTNQAEKFGVELLRATQVVNIRTEGKYREVIARDGKKYGARAVLIATGAHYRQLDVPGEEKLIGVNIHFCATCDGAFYKGDDVLVIGGGNSGFQEGLFLTNYAKKVTIVEFMPEPNASEILQRKVQERDDIEVVTNHAVKEFVVEDGELEAVRVENRETGEMKEWRPDGVFVFIGYSPNSGFLPDEIERNRQGFVVTDKTLQTTMTGVYAAGDVRAGSTAQLASAAGEGAAVALMMREYLEEHE